MVSLLDYIKFQFNMMLLELIHFLKALLFLTFLLSMTFLGLADYINNHALFLLLEACEVKLNNCDRLAISDFYTSQFI